MLHYAAVFEIIAVGLFRNGKPEGDVIAAVQLWSARRRDAEAAMREVQAKLKELTDGGRHVAGGVYGNKREAQMKAQAVAQLLYYLDDAGEVQKHEGKYVTFDAPEDHLEI